MATHLGLLVVHGIGEQKRFETTRQLAQSLIAGLQHRGEGTRFSLIDRTSDPHDLTLVCPPIDRQSSPFTIAFRTNFGTETYLHLHEVWWADLGAPSNLREQFRFWLWGLGQWGSKVVWSSHFRDLQGKNGSEAAKSNTDLLMEPPTLFRDVSSDGRSFKPRIFARSMLFLTALYALLTLLSWEALKRAFTWLSSAAGSPSILTSYVGDVRIYTQAPGKGGGNLTDLGQPWRATIRRRMISQMVAMAERDYDRWYVLGHSLGSVVAYNGVQEPEWNLPNYLDPRQIDRIKAGTMGSSLWRDASPQPDEPIPDLSRMMPRRPIWLQSKDRISRIALFAKFGGLITYGSPLDKFAALWPRIVPINRQRSVFPDDASWINLSDATDPVGANIQAFRAGWNFNTPPEKSPVNIRVKASAFFLLSHIRYFGVPNAKRAPETKALVNLLFPLNDPLSLGEAFKDVASHYGSHTLRLALAFLWVVSLGVGLVAATSWLALILKRLGTETMVHLTPWLKAHWPIWLEQLGVTHRIIKSCWDNLIHILASVPISGFLGTMATTLLTVCIVVFCAGIWRRYMEI